MLELVSFSSTWQSFIFTFNVFTVNYYFLLCLIIAPRSGLALKHSIDTGAGVIDYDYRGPVGVILFNHADTEFIIKKGDRVAQLILERISMADIQEVAELSSTERGTGGFGSTGILHYYTTFYTYKYYILYYNILICWYTTYIGVKQPLDTTTTNMSIEEADKENETAIAKRNKLDNDTNNTAAME